MAIAVTIGEIRSDTKLFGSNASTNYAGANGETGVLLLRSHAEMVAMNLCWWYFGFGGIESEAEAFVKCCEEGVGCPAVLKEKEFETGFFARLAQNVRRAEQLGDRAYHRDDLMPLDEGVEADSEVRLSREAAAYAKGETDFV